MKNMSKYQKCICNTKPMDKDVLASQNFPET